MGNPVNAGDTLRVSAVVQLGCSIPFVVPCFEALLRPGTIASGRKNVSFVGWWALGFRGIFFSPYDTLWGRMKEIRYPLNTGAKTEILGRMPSWCVC